MFWLPPKQPANENIKQRWRKDDETKRKGKRRSQIKRRKQRGAFVDIVQELGIEDTAGFKEILRIEYSNSLHLLSLVGLYNPQEFYISSTGLDKFTSARPIFRARQKTGAQNQSKYAGLIQKYLKTFIFVFCYLIRTCCFLFYCNSIKSFSNEALTVYYHYLFV